MKKTDAMKKSDAKILAASLRALSREMDRVAFSLAECGIIGCKWRADELLGAANMARSWAKDISRIEK